MPSKTFHCPAFVPSVVELTDERERHIEQRHPDLLPDHMQELSETLADPEVAARNRYSIDKNALAKWFPNLRGGKYLVVQVVTERLQIDRHWIVTAYLYSDPPS